MYYLDQFEKVQTGCSLFEQVVVVVVFHMDINECFELNVSRRVIPC